MTATITATVLVLAVIAFGVLALRELDRRFTAAERQLTGTVRRHRRRGGRPALNHR